MNRLNSGKAAVVAALSLALLALAVPASAQTNMRVDVPFAFIAGNQVLPAGTYNLVIDANFSICHLDSFTNGSVHMVHFVPGKARSSAKIETGVVQFEKYGDHYVMSGVWKPGYTDGLATVTSHRMLETAKAEGVAETVSIEAQR